MISNLERMKREQFSNFWGFGEKTKVDKALSKLNSENASASEVAVVASDRDSVNAGRAENDGSINWGNILQAGADVMSQFGNQNQVQDFDERDWQTNNSSNNDVKSETKILGMHPVTFGAVAISLVVIAGVVAYKVTVSKKP